MTTALYLVSGDPMPDKTHNAILRGEQAANWMANAQVKAVFADLEEDIALLWARTASDQDDERERLYREMHGLRALKRRILKIIDDGKKAQARLDADGK